MLKEYKGCLALIYNEQGDLLTRVRILEYDEGENSIEVEELPELPVGGLCEVMILTAPKPYAYRGRVHKRGGHIVITLFQGGEAEHRQETRYKIEMPADIESLVCDGVAYPLHSSVETQVVNISQSGVRIRADYHALSEGDRIKLHIKAGGKDKLLTADVVNHKDSESEFTEFGCHLVGGEDV
ncbi:MAG: PilZ domain-containing protein [Oscillospiraceae bacterium]|nr:PilZ domain-containing protein [Oscillospiraceae bacterium]